MNTVTRTGIVLSALSLALAPAALAAEKAPPKAEPKGHVAKSEAGAEVTLTGKVVDLACWSSNTLSDDHTRCTADSLKAGVPAALETSRGLVLLGKGKKGCGEMMAEFAMKEVRIKGKLYERGGVKYLDIMSIVKTGSAAAHPVEPKAQAQASESRRNIRIYPPGELSKAQARSAGKTTVKKVKTVK